jgi:hypothetical protein
MRQGIQWWALGSGVLMVIGAFGPWVTAFAISVSGTDGSNDGWLVVAAAVIGGGLLYAMRQRKSAGVWALLGGVAGLAVTAYDRGNVQNAIDRGGAFAQAVAHVGWGLNLSLLASLSMAIAGLVALIQARSAADATPSAPSSAPPSVATPASAPPPDWQAATSSPATGESSTAQAVLPYLTGRQGTETAEPSEAAPSPSTPPSGSTADTPEELPPSTPSAPAPE